MLSRTSKAVPSLEGSRPTQRPKKRSRLLDYVCRRSSLALLLLPVALLASLYVVSSEEAFTFEPRLSFYSAYNVVEGKYPPAYATQEIDLSLIRRNAGRLPGVELEMPDAVEETGGPVDPGLREEGKVSKVLEQASAQWSVARRERQRASVLEPDRLDVPSRPRVLLGADLSARAVRKTDQTTRQRRLVDRVSILQGGCG